MKCSFSYLKKQPCILCDKRKVFKEIYLTFFNKYLSKDQNMDHSQDFFTKLNKNKNRGIKLK